MRIRTTFAAVLIVSSLALSGMVSAASPARKSLELLTTGPAAGHPPYEPGVAKLSADGRHLFFNTRERLVPQDQDGGCLDPNADDPQAAPRIDCGDVYERFKGHTRLVSSGGNGSYDAGLVAISSDGSKAFFVTSEALLPQDTDNTGDIYEWSNGSLRLIDTGTSGNFQFIGASDDGSKVFFQTADRLSPLDQNNCKDTYVYSGGSTVLVSTGPNDGPVSGYPCDSLQADDFRPERTISSPDGAHFFFYSYRSLVAADTGKGDRDLYERTGNQTTLVSTGPASGMHERGPSSGGEFQTASPDGSRVFFRTLDQLVLEDTNTTFDNYERDSSGVHLFEPAQIRSDPTLHAAPLATSYDGSRVFLWTNARLAPDDTNTSYDIYERFRGSYSLVSTGPYNGPQVQGINLGRFEISRDGTRAFFETDQQLVPEDTDNKQDVYERVGGATRLMTPGTQDAVFTPWWSTTPDGRRFFFQTLEPLVPQDTNTKFDVYESHNGTVRLIDPGVPTTDDVRLDWTLEYERPFSNDGTRMIIFTRQALTPNDTDTLGDLYGLSAKRSRGRLGAASHDSFKP